jgi:hypothetical protein
MAFRLLWVIPVLALAFLLVGAPAGVWAADDGNRGEIQGRPKGDPFAVDSELPTAAALEALGARIRRDERRPGRPVVGVALSVKLGKRVALPCLAGLPQLEVLSLYGTSIGDAGLKELSRLEHLTTLNIEEDRTVTEEGLTALRKVCPQLSIYREFPRQTGIIRYPALAP